MTLVLVLALVAGMLPWAGRRHAARLADPLSGDVDGTRRRADDVAAIPIDLRARIRYPDAAGRSLQQARAKRFFEAFDLPAHRRRRAAQLARGLGEIAGIDDTGKRRHVRQQRKKLNGIHGSARMGRAICASAT